MLLHLVRRQPARVGEQIRLEGTGACQRRVATQDHLRHRAVLAVHQADRGSRATDHPGQPGQHPLGGGTGGGGSRGAQPLGQ